MRTWSFTLADGRPCLLVTITRTDGEVIRICTNSSSITIDGDLFLPHVGLKMGDVTERNDGTVSSVGIELAWEVGGTFDPVDVALGMYERAEFEVELTNADSASTRDYYFSGYMLGPTKLDLRGLVSFELFNKFGVPRDIFVRQYQLLCDADFGDPLRCKMPILPDDVARLETIAVGEFRRVRFTSSSPPVPVPSEYDNKYLECTAITTGITASSVPSWNTTIGGTTVDGGVTWTTRNAYARYGEVASVTDDHNIVLTTTADPREVTDNTWFDPCTIAFRSGSQETGASEEATAIPR